LDRKVNWIGVGPHKHVVPDKCGPIVTFDHFKFFGSDGPDFEQLAPVLAARIYSKNIRVLMNGLSRTDQAEVERILGLAKNAPPSSRRESVANSKSKPNVRKTADLFPKRSIKGCSR